MAETTSEWSEVVVTSLGLRLDAKVKAGLTGFRVAKVTVGDGFLDEGDNPLSLTDLKHEIPSHQSGTEGDTTTADITIIRAIDTGTAAVKVRIQNGNESFYLREIGIWAVDPDLGLILYAYTNAGDNARMLEAYNGRTHIIRKLTIPFLLSNTADITANCTFISEVSEEAFDAYKAEVNNRFNTVIPISEKGSAGGVAELDENGLVPSSQLPSYVDDILEYDGISAFPVTGESGKIYVDKATNKQYRWSGTQYTEVSKSLALGETESTAYRGDRGKMAYDHATANGNPHNLTKGDIGLGNVDNTSDMNKPISNAVQNALTPLQQAVEPVTLGSVLDIMSATGKASFYHFTLAGWTEGESHILTTVFTTFGYATFGKSHGTPNPAQGATTTIYIMLYEKNGYVMWDEYYYEIASTQSGKVCNIGNYQATYDSSTGNEGFYVNYSNPSAEEGETYSLREAIQEIDKCMRIETIITPKIYRFDGSEHYPGDRFKEEVKTGDYCMFYNNTSSELSGDLYPSSGTLSIEGAINANSAALCHRYDDTHIKVIPIV